MKTIRTWVYALLQYGEKIVVIKKWRWPFIGRYDLPWGKIEHGEKNKKSLQREIIEEVWLKSSDFTIEKLLAVEEDFVKHVWNNEEKDEHLIAIIYLVKIRAKVIDLDYIEQGWDANWLKLINIDNTNIPKTNILQKILNNLNK